MEFAVSLTCTHGFQILAWSCDTILPFEADRLRCKIELQKKIRGMLRIFSFYWEMRALSEEQQGCLPGSEGVIETRFTDAKWKDKSPVCRDTAFTWPISHPIK